MMLINIVFVIGAYLLGSLPVLQWIARMRGFDLSQEHDMHQALWRKVGFAEGLAGILWDILKGLIPPLAAILWLDLDILVAGLSGLAVTTGQMWPIFTRFYGKERGNTTGIGACFGIAPLPMAVAVIPVTIGAVMRLMSSAKKSDQTNADRMKFSGVSDSLPLGMLVTFAILPLVAWGFHQEPAAIWTFAALFALLMFRRVTADLAEDIRADPKPKLASVLKNRFLYDRSFH